MNFRIPQGDGSKNKEWLRTVMISAELSFEELLHSIHKVLGCDHLKDNYKPSPLTFHLSKDKKAERYGLQNEDDWEHLKRQYAMEIAAKGAQAKVDIGVPDGVSGFRSY